MKREAALGYLIIVLLLGSLAVSLALPAVGVTPRAKFTFPEEFLKGFGKMAGGKGELLKVFERKASEVPQVGELCLVLDVSGGGVEVKECSGDFVYRVEVYTSKWWFGKAGEGAKYDVRDEVADGSMTLTVTGSGVQLVVEVNPLLISVIDVDLSGGGIYIDLSSGNLKEFSLDGAGCGSEINLRGLNSTKVELGVSGGGFEALLEYGEVRDSPTLAVNVDAGGGEVTVKLPSGVKVSATGKASAGSLEISVEDLGEISISHGSKTLEDSGFTEGLIVSASVSAGGVEITVER